VPEIKQNPVKGVDLLKNINKTERFLQATEIKALLNALEDSPNPLLKYFVPLALLTGARKRELLDARWSDIDFESKVWRIPMTKSGRPLNVPLTPQAFQLLLHLQSYLPSLLEAVPKEGVEWVFPNPKTNQPYISIFNAWNTARNKAGLAGLRIHDLRHSFASALVNHGIPIYDVQKLLGHQSIKTTERYSHLSPERLRQSASAASVFLCKSHSNVFIGGNYLCQHPFLLLVLFSYLKPSSSYPFPRNSITDIACSTTIFWENYV
jgi:integrase